MKSDFILAFNEIAEVRKLPREVVLEALKAALVSAYRRNSGSSSAQQVEVRIDEHDGTPSIWVEKEVVEDVSELQTEVLFSTAHEVYDDVQLGDVVLVDSTPKDFGRIAAQTAKQVILQRMREAERDAQYLEYQERMGDLVTGTVQSNSGDVVTIGLGRAEAILPRSQQMPGERYPIHSKVRAYVMEVRKTNRGPQIVVSRTHREMLRRLLEYEVPEIYNGAVEIKSIAREPGARSKVAVAALQPGADPVGACVGMRGVRIQSIVKELNGEKIDVIEWNAENDTFISKSLSPARVSMVLLDDDPDEGRTATVVVPDDQLSLAIGREGQNARLAAKLTGWRIDIKSISEAALDTFTTVQETAGLIEAAELSQETLDSIAHIMEKKAENRPIMPEDYHMMADFLKAVEFYRLSIRESERSERRVQIEEAKLQVPAVAYEFPLDETDLPLRIYNLLDEAGYKTAGQVFEQYFVNQERLTSIAGFGPAALEEVEKMINTIEFPEVEEVLEEQMEEEGVDGSAVSDEVVEEGLEAETVADDEEGIVEVDEDSSTFEQAWEEEDEIARQRRAELVARMSDALDVDPDREALEAGLKIEAELEALKATEEGSEVPELVDEEAFGSEILDEEGVFGEDDDEELRRRREKQLRRQLVFDEDLGRVVAKRRRKRGSDDWGDFDVENLEEIEEEE